MSVSEILTLLALIVSAFSVFMAWKKNSAKSTEQQVRLEVKMDNLHDACSGIHEDVRHIRDKQNQQGEELAKMEVEITRNAARIEKLERQFAKAHPPA